MAVDIPATGATAVNDDVLIDEGLASSHPPSAAEYPSASSIPQTSPERLAAEADESGAHDTVFYLGYGSNMCAQTFLGMRGIRPLSKVNVMVPMLRLTTSLPGLPYIEPCFANVEFRKLPDKPKLPMPIDPPDLLPHPPSALDDWNHGLIGVVYEVTRADYRHIISTEGSGTSYKEIIVPCVPIPPRFSIPEKSPLPELPKPFMARTLYCPYVPRDKLPGGWKRFFLPHQRPTPDHSQASLRYLNLLRTGAQENELPDEYQLYLASLIPFTITTRRQKVGKIVTTLFFLPVILLFIRVLLKVFADKDGKAPPWLAAATNAAWNILWSVYDHVFKPLFGDGEHSLPEGEEAHKARRAGEANEKTRLLENDES